MTSLLIPQQTTAATESWELIGQVGGTTQAVAAVSNKVFVGSGQRLTVLNITTPSIPIVLGASVPLGDFIQDIVISGNYVYVAAGKAGLGIINVSDPVNPILIARWDSPGFAEGLAIKNDIVYLANGAYGLSIIDVSDPTTPFLIGSAFAGYYTFELSLQGDYAYLAAGSAGLLIVNILDPFNPIEINQVDTDGFVYGVTTSATIAYLADGWHGIQVVDILNPHTAYLRDHFVTKGWALAVDLYGSTLFVAAGVNGLRIVNVSNPDSLYETGSFETSASFVRRLFCIEYRVFLADNQRGMLIINASNQPVPVELGVYHQMSEARYVKLDGNHAYVASGGEGNFYSVNVSDVIHPYQEGKFIASGYASSVGINGSHAYLSTFMDSPNYLWVINKTNPQAMTQTTVVPLSSLIPPNGAARELVIYGNFVYVADEWGLRIYDINVPASIHLEGQIQLLGTYGESVGLDVSGNYAYVSGSTSGVIVIDINNPASPVYVNTIPAEGFNQAVAVSGTRLYAANADSGIQVFDISNPLSVPAPLGKYDTRGYANSVFVDGTIVFVSDGLSGVQVLDVSDPTAISLIQSIDTAGYAYHSQVVGDLLYVADGSGGLAIYQNQTRQVIVKTESAQSLPQFKPLRLFEERSVDLTELEASTLPDLPAPEIRVTCTVTKTADDSTSGTLRTCLNSATVGTLINFSTTQFPPGTPAVIYLTSPLPQINSDGITIDASNAGVILDGSNTQETALVITSSSNQVMGLQIRNFTMNGIKVEFPSQFNTIGGDHLVGDALNGEGNVITGCFNGIMVLYASLNIISGNFIGTNPSGTSAGVANNIGIAISTEASYNLIGGASSGKRNIISNNGRGIDIADGTAQFNTVAGNYIGTDILGMTAIPNNEGIIVEVGARNNTIGGDTPSKRNLVSGNSNVGIVVTDALTSQNSVIGNWVGVDASGLGAMPNGNNGISVFSTAFNRVGGSLPGEGNLVSGHTNHTAIIVQGFEKSDTILLGNQVGLNSEGNPNLTNGVGIGVSNQHNFVGGLGNGDANIITSEYFGIELNSAGAISNWLAGNRISGGSIGVYIHNAATRNLLAFNRINGANEGVRVDATSHNTLRANAITGNTWKGISLLDGGNASLAAPVPDSATDSGIAGDTCAYCLVEIFSDPGNQGLLYEGSQRADGSGNFFFNKRLLGPNITLTATDAEGNTSEFSNPYPISWIWYRHFLPVVTR